MSYIQGDVYFEVFGAVIEVTSENVLILFGSNSGVFIHVELRRYDFCGQGRNITVLNYRHLIHLTTIYNIIMQS